MGNISFQPIPEFFKAKFYCSKLNFTVQYIVNIEGLCG